MSSNPLRTAVAALVAIALATLSLRADESKTVRIDLNAEKDGVKLQVDAVSDGARAKNSEWRKDKQDFWITAVFPSQGTQWSEGSFTFTPQSSGRVVIILKGPYVRPSSAGDPLKLIWAYFDEIRATGATIVNPGFEELQGERPAGWYRPPPPTGVTLPPESLADLDPTHPAAGRFSARVWHHSSFSQSIEVQAGKPVTLTFKHRLYD